MINRLPKADRFLYLVSAVCDGVASRSELDELDALLLANPDARRRYLDLCQLHFTLLPELRADWLVQQLRQHNNLTPDDFEPDPPAAIPSPTVMIEPPSPRRLPPIAPTTFDHMPSVWPVFCLAALIVLGSGIVIATMTHVSRSMQAVTQSAPLPAVVGRITGMADCIWENSSVLTPTAPAVASNRPSTANEGGLSSLPRAGEDEPKRDPQESSRAQPPDSIHLIRLGDRFVLRSGLLEITYDTGARVILQGPVTYEVNSATGGYLAIGKLTARLEKSGSHAKNCVPSQPAAALTDSLKEGTQDSEPRSSTHDRSRPACHPPLFTIKTPTAIVTDLGTEFGVDVSPENETRVAVMQGRVEMRSSSADSAKSAIVREGQSSRVDAGGALVRQPDGKGSENAVFTKAFVRELPQNCESQFVSLVDLVAGGNGFGDRHSSGINPEDGSVRMNIVAPKVKKKAASIAYNRYHGHRQIDGVFVPVGGSTPVQLDSVGHKYLLPKTTQQYHEFSLLAYKGEPWVVPSSDGMASGPRPMLSLHANSGITLDLAVIRDSAGGRNPVQFTASVLNGQWDMQPTRDFSSSVWVFVDGRPIFSRPKLRKKDGIIDLNIPLHPNDRFLTLVSTDAGDSISFAHVGLLDPRLVLEAARAANHDDAQQKK
jgi:hypothetical protein